MWKRSVSGKVLHFYLAGINNQNFLMRDKETGTWWQQISGRAVFGPMKGAVLELVPSDELTFGEWKSEVTGGKVLAPVPKYVKEYDSKWESEVAKLPVVISFPGTELKSRDVVVGLKVGGASRAYPWDTLLKQSPVVDRVKGTPLLVVVGPDQKSFRVFISRIDGKDAEFYLKGENGEPGEKAEAASSSVQSKQTADVPTSRAQNPREMGHPADDTARNSQGKDQAVAANSSSTAATSSQTWALLDTTTASEWNFQGCAVAGPAQGKCLERVPALKDYWFDWRNYNVNTTIYKH